MKNNWNSFLFICLAFVAASCETDLKVNADYTRTAVVYGLLEKQDTNHLIKITKTFLGDGNAYDFAQIADSSKIPNLVAEIQAWKGNALKKKYPLTDTVINGKESGSFYSGSQFMYYFREPNLDPTMEYKLSFYLDGKEISASTPVLPNYRFKSPAPGSAIEMIDGDIRTSQVLNNHKQKIVIGPVESGNPANLVAETEFRGTFVYTEVYKDGSSAQKSFSFDMGKTNTLERFYEASGFWSALESSIKPDPNVERRSANTFNIEAISYPEDFKTFLAVNNPVSGVVQERPEYSNINNGLGLFSSRTSAFYSKALSSNSEAYLIRADRFSGLNFCSTTYTDPGISCK